MYMPRAKKKEIWVGKIKLKANTLRYNILKSRLSTNFTSISSVCKEEMVKNPKKMFALVVYTIWLQRYRG